MGGNAQRHGYGSHRPESFSRYYLRNVLSEGCGCAELVLTARDPAPIRRSGPAESLWALVRRLAARHLPFRRGGSARHGTTAP